MPIKGSAAGKVHGVVRGVGSTVAGAVLGTFAQGVAGSHSGATMPGMAEQLPELADGIPITAVVRRGGLTPPDLPLRSGVVGIYCFCQADGEPADR